MSNEEYAATLLRESVQQAVKEWSNSDHSVTTAGGAWKQDQWGSAPYSVVSQWGEEMVKGRNHPVLVAPQGALVCGTTGCVAAHLAAAAGWRFSLRAPKNVIEEAFREGDVVEISHAVRDGHRESIAAIGINLLYPLGSPRDVPCANGVDKWGYTPTHDLFSGGNSITQVVVVADRLLRVNDMPPTGVSLLGLPQAQHVCKCVKECV